MQGPHNRPARQPGKMRVKRTQGGQENEHRRSASTPRHNRQATPSRRATRPSAPNAPTTCNGVSPGKEKEHPDGATTHTHRERRKRGRAGGRYRETRNSTDPAPCYLQRAACTHHKCTAPPYAVVVQFDAPAPRLGGLRASPGGRRGDNRVARARQRQPSSAAMHQGGDVVDKRLQPACSLTHRRGSGKMGMRRRNRARSAVNLGEFTTKQQVCHGRLPNRPRWGAYRIPRPGGPPGAEGRLVPETSNLKRQIASTKYQRLPHSQGVALWTVQP